MNTAIYYDQRLPQHGKPLHPKINGQHMMAEAIEPTLARPMGEALRMPLASMMEPMAATNGLLARHFGQDSSVTYLDIGAKFLSKDGSLAPALMPDGTHPIEAGYEIWADALATAGATP